MRSPTSHEQRQLAAEDQQLPSKLSQVVSGSGAILVLRALGAGGRYVTLVILAQWLPLNAFGRISVMLAVISILGIPATLGMNGAALRFVPVYSREPGLLQGFLRRSQQIVLAAGATVAIGGVLLVGIARGAVSDPVLWLVGVLSVPAYALVTLLTDTLRGLRRSGTGYALQQACVPLLMLVLIWLLRHLGLLTPAAALGANAVALALTAATLFALVTRQVRRTTRHNEPSFHTREWLAVALPLFLTGSFLVIMNQSDVVMVGLLRGSGAAGQYAAAAQTAMLVGFILFAINGYIAPLVSVLANEGRTPELQLLLTRTSHLLFWPSLATAVAITVAAPWILRLFGSAFAAGATALTVLVAAQVFSAGAGPVGLLLEVSGHQRVSALARGVGAVTNLALDVALIPWLGISGAAIATGFTVILWNLWLHEVARRRIGVRASILSTLLRRDAS